MEEKISDRLDEESDKLANQIREKFGCLGGEEVESQEIEVQVEGNVVFANEDGATRTVFSVSSIGSGGIRELSFCPKYGKTRKIARLKPLETSCMILTGEGVPDYLAHLAGGTMILGDILEKCAAAYRKYGHEEASWL